MKTPTVFLTALSLVAVGVAFLGISQITAPGSERLFRLDNKRLVDLHDIANRLRTYHKEKNHLPSSLAPLNLRQKELEDAVTKQPYEYRVVDSDSYQLCAVFDAAPDEDHETNALDYDNCSIPWRKHAQGRYCYTIAVKDCK